MGQPDEITPFDPYAAPRPTSALIPGYADPMRPEPFPSMLEPSMQTVPTNIPNPVVAMSPDPLNTVYRPEPVPAAKILPQAPPEIHILPIGIPNQEPTPNDVTVHMEGPTINITMPDMPSPEDAEAPANETEEPAPAIPVSLNLTDAGLITAPNVTAEDISPVNATNVTEPVIGEQFPNVTIDGVTYAPPQPEEPVDNVTINGVMYKAVPEEAEAPNVTLEG